MDSTYLDKFAGGLGCLMGNLLSLEWSVRNLLYQLKHPPHTGFSDVALLYEAKPGDVLPQNALTSWAPLGPLIDAFNQKYQATPLDADLKTLGDAFAHGRPLGLDDSWQHLVLMKFSRPDGNGHVQVEVRYDLTLGWMNDQIARVRRAIDVVLAREQELNQ